MRADLILLHPPAFFDFRDRDDILFPYLSTSGDVPITPLYEYFPLGFKTLQRTLGERGHSVRIVNLASTMLRYPSLDVPAFLGSLDAKVFGIDLHWMVHVQGALAVAALLKRVHPEIPVLLGGISATYYADELLRYPQVDLVLAGYDTHEPAAILLGELSGGRRFARVPNLWWKDPESGEVRANPFDHKPSTFACGIDWSVQPAPDPANKLPILEILSTQNAGCAYNCNWCGGSREAFRRVMKRQKAMARKPSEEVAWEFGTIRSLPGRERYHFYSVGSYNETPERFSEFLDLVGEAGFRSVSYEQFFLTPEPVLRRMVAANPRTTITLSPESHDLGVAKLAGRGVYTMEEMEEWCERALGLGIFQIDVWFFIGMQEQTPDSVRSTVDYCGKLLRRFRGRNVNPLVCPMIPFLDPASTFFEEPRKYGYEVHFRTVEEHRRGMENLSLLDRINYSTRWLSRRDLVVTGYEAVCRLFELKGEHGALPRGVAAGAAAKGRESLEFLLAVDAASRLADPGARARELASLGPEIRRRNGEIFGGAVSNQAFPIDRRIGGRWFDEIPDLDLLRPALEDLE